MDQGSTNREHASEIHLCKSNSKSLKLFFYNIFSSPGPKAPGELIGWDASQRLLVRMSVRSLLNINISETSRVIQIKFHLEYHWGGGKAA